MTKAEAKRDEIAERLADFVLLSGLSGASLRPLAAAAGTSDRMLLYYFKDKEDIISTVLQRVAQRLAARLVALDQQAPRSVEDLEPDLLAMATSAELWPFMCVWLEIAALAARGDPLFRAIGGQIAAGFTAWIAGRLAIDDQAERDAAALRLLRTIDGAVVLHGLGMPASP